MFDHNAALDKVLAKLERTGARVKDSIPYRSVDGVYTQRLRPDGSLEIDWWTNGFWPGMLWLAYRETGKDEYARWATSVEGKLDEALMEFTRLHHDVGFMWHLSAVADYKLTGSKEAAKRGFIAANILAARFNPAGPFIRAWNGEPWAEHQDWTGWAIIDCMMNLSILYWAADYRKDRRFYHIAVAHAETVQKHFIYPDGSSKHIVEFDPNTGAYVKNYGGQGYSVDSAWSRGAAWALHGFALSARYTGRQDFLDTAKRIALFFVSNLPEDKVPFADFKAPAELNTCKDSSAAACAAGGLLILSRLVPEDEKAFYHDSARQILASLYDNYTDWEGDEALLQKGCIAFHEKEGHNTTLIYADYFFLEALLMLNDKDGLF